VPRTEDSAATRSVCVAKAALAALDAVGAGKRAGMAVPDNKRIPSSGSRVPAPLAALGGATFWVGEDGEVQAANEVAIEVAPADGR
jgi:hypothetical protein